MTKVIKTTAASHGSTITIERSRRYWRSVGNRFGPGRAGAGGSGRGGVGRGGVGRAASARFETDRAGAEARTVTAGRRGGPLFSATRAVKGSRVRVGFAAAVVAVAIKRATAEVLATVVARRVFTLRFRVILRHLVSTKQRLQQHLFASI